MPRGSRRPSKTRVYLLICAFILISLLYACMAYPQPVQEKPDQENETASSPLIVPDLTPISGETLSSYDLGALQFDEGRYNRDDFCSRIFNYQRTSYGSLFIAIENDLAEIENRQEIASKIINLYINLYEKTPIPFSYPVTVYVIPEPENGECLSRGQLVFADPKALEERSFIEDLLGAGTGINEHWIKAGLATLAVGKQPDQDTLSEWYQTTDDLDMTSLFIARFNPVWATADELEIARMSAASLLQFVLEEEQIPADQLIKQLDNGVRTRWLESIGVERVVSYPYDGHFTGFNYSQSEDCNLIVDAENLHFCLNAQPGQAYLDEVSEVEFLIDNTFYGRKALIEYIRSNAPSVSHLMNTSETIQIEVIDFPGPGAVTQVNTIKLKDSAVFYSPLHEMVHTFDWNKALFHKQEYWLLEGSAEYLGTLLPIYQQSEKRAIFEDLNDRELSQGVSYWYDLDEEQLSTAEAWYLAQGGELENEDAIDPRLFVDAVAFATMYRDALGGVRGFPIGAKLEILKPNLNLTGIEGLELSYTQAASFVGWLSDTYSLDRVLDVYVNQAEDGKLDGKRYEELKTEWLADLQTKGQGIPIPEAP
ncbi:MAG: hypothetical protein SVT56_11820 [Chloroflexota bacterium]|nr:hypothetical protein [Chloroflexota bacterium]